MKKFMSLMLVLAAFSLGACTKEAEKPAVAPTNDEEVADGAASPAPVPDEMADKDAKEAPEPQENHSGAAE